MQQSSNTYRRISLRFLDYECFIGFCLLQNVTQVQTALGVSVEAEGNIVLASKDLIYKYFVNKMSFFDSLNHCLAVILIEENGKDPIKIFVRGEIEFHSGWAQENYSYYRFNFKGKKTPPVVPLGIPFN